MWRNTQAANRFTRSWLVFVVVRLEGFEPPTLGSVDRCSNPLSYRRAELRTVILPELPRSFKMTQSGIDTRLAGQRRRGQ